MRPIDLSPRDTYIEGLYAEEDAGLRSIRERLVTADRWGVNISAAEGKLLQFFIKLINAKKVVEIGTLFGYSGVWMARALPSGGRLYTIERDHDAVRMAKKAFEECEVQDQVTLLEGEAIDKLKDLSREAPFDMVFIDANKTSYNEYLEWATTHVRPGGLIIADNTLLGGKLAEVEKPEELSQRQWTEMRRFNSSITDVAKYFGTIIPTAEGLTVAIRR